MPPKIYLFLNEHIIQIAALIFIPVIFPSVNLIHSLITIARETYSGICIDFRIKKRYRSPQDCHVYLKGHPNGYKLPKAIIGNIKIGDHISKNGFIIKIGHNEFDILSSLIIEALIGYLVSFGILAILLSLQFLPGFR